MPGSTTAGLAVRGAISLAATLVGALTVATVLWREPLGRLRARMVGDATVITGLDTLTMPLLQRLAQTRRRTSIVVIEPDSGHPLLDEARATGARVMIGDRRPPGPCSGAGRPRGCALRQFYALRQDAAENDAILTAANGVLHRYPPDPDRQPHLVARIDDPRHANHWRGGHSGNSGLSLEDALSPLESTACALVNQIFAAGARHLLLCGDSTLALAILLELARCLGVAELSRAAHRPCRAPMASAWVRPTRRSSAPHPVQRVVLLDRRAEDLRREYQATSPHSVAAGRRR